MQRLVGKRALITGGARGLGRAIALAFAVEGADVAISYHRSEEMGREVVADAERRGVGAAALAADLADRSQITALAEKAVAALGGIDVLVNNAGLFSAKPFGETDPDLWDRMLAVNLTAPFLLAREIVPDMLAAGGGVIVNLASGGGQHPHPGYSTSPAYAASKAGLIMLTKKLALELAPTIRVNCIAPGVVDSKPRPMSEAARERFAAVAPLARMGSPEEIAAAAVFLASEEASFITGQVLNVDGGILM